MFNSLQFFEFGRNKNMFEPEYQAVLDYAVANSITIPPLSQNLINNAIVLNLKSENIWSTRDLFYYGKYDYTSFGLQEFSTLNWIDPTKYRLYNDNPLLVPDFIDDFGWKHNADGKFWKTGFVPITHSINTEANNVGGFYKLFDFPTVFGTYNRIFGARSANNSSQIFHINDTNNGVIQRNFMTGYSLITPFLQTEINSLFCFSKDNTTNSVNIVSVNNVTKNEITFVSGSLSLATRDIALLALNENGSYVAEGIGGMEYFSLGSHIKHNMNEIYQIMTGAYFNKKISTPSISVLTTADITLPTIYWFKPYLASDFPSITTEKKYILLWSTDHSPSFGGIYWGECDDLNINGFVERGKIIDGFQAETPYLFLYPDDPDGHIIHLYYHTYASDPSNNGYQQTKLLTTTGGLLHTTSWVQRGSVLGIVNPPTTESHTGYCLPFLKEDNSLVAIHLCKQFFGATLAQVNKYGKSTSVNGRTWLRESSYINFVTYMPYRRVLHIDQGIYFKRNSVQYLICVNSAYEMEDYTYKRISIFGCDGNYYPTSLIGNISRHENGETLRTISFYIENDIVHIYYNTYSKTEIYYAVFDLKKLDN